MERTFLKWKWLELIYLVGNHVNISDNPYMCVIISYLIQLNSLSECEWHLRAGRIFFCGSGSYNSRIERISPYIYLRRLLYITTSIVGYYYFLILSKKSSSPILYATFFRTNVQRNANK